MGLDEISSGKTPGEKETSLIKPLLKKDGSTSDSIMTNPNDSVRLTDEQKYSIMNLKKDSKALTEYELQHFLNILQSKSGLPHSIEIYKKSQDTFFKGLSSEINQELLGIGTNRKDVLNAREKELKFMNTVSYTDENGILHEPVEDQAKQYLKEQFGIEPTNENIRKIINDELSLNQQTESQRLSEKHKKAHEHSGEGLADLVSGIFAFKTYSKMIGSGIKVGKLGIALSLARAALTGGIVKALFKGGDKLFTDTANYSEDLFEKYYYNRGHNIFITIPEVMGGVINKTCQETSFSDISKAFLTGAFSGVLAPITGGIGGLFGKKVAAKAGL